jgi:hypothetical protein
VLEIEKGKRVKVANPNQINYPLEGEVIKKEVASDGTKMSKVKFSIFTEVWYADKDLTEV